MIPEFLLRNFFKKTSDLLLRDKLLVLLVFLLCQFNRNYLPQSRIFMETGPPRPICNFRLLFFLFFSFTFPKNILIRLPSTLVISFYFLISQKRTKCKNIRTFVFSLSLSLHLCLSLSLCQFYLIVCNACKDNVGEFQCTILDVDELLNLSIAQHHTNRQTFSWMYEWVENRATHLSSNSCALKCVSKMLYIYIYIYIYIYMLFRYNHINNSRWEYTHTHTHIYIYILCFSPRGLWTLARNSWLPHVKCKSLLMN